MDSLSGESPDPAIIKRLYATGWWNAEPGCTGLPILTFSTLASCKRRAVSFL